MKLLIFTLLPILLLYSQQERVDSLFLNLDMTGDGIWRAFLFRGILMAKKLSLSMSTLTEKNYCGEVIPFWDLNLI
jgi:hypothetical protein